ncbi:type VI secretion protein, partial [Streptomyces sp. AC154]
MAGRGEARSGGNAGGSGGIPDELLIGLLAFLLGLTLLAWTATGLSGLLAHGAWPHGVTLAETPLAIRRLVEAPHDLPAAWPTTPAGALSGYGLFWGLFIGELMVLVVLTIFVMGVVARWRDVRSRQRAQRLDRLERLEEHQPERAAQQLPDLEKGQDHGHQSPAPAPAPAPVPTPTERLPEPQQQATTAPTATPATTTELLATAAPLT